jgi:hypothetical protein
MKRAIAANRDNRRAVASIRSHRLAVVLLFLRQSALHISRRRKDPERGLRGRRPRNEARGCSSCDRGRGCVQACRHSACWRDRSSSKCDRRQDPLTRQELPATSAGSTRTPCKPQCSRPQVFTCGSCVAEEPRLAAAVLACVSAFTRTRAGTELGCVGIARRATFGYRRSLRSWDGAACGRGAHCGSDSTRCYGWSGVSSTHLPAHGSPGPCSTPLVQR